jgi:SynChlorMet cassette protein ScmC
MDSQAEAGWVAGFRFLAAVRAAIIITYNFTTALKAEAIHVMERVQIVESGGHAEIVEMNGRYAQSWRERVQKDGNDEYALGYCLSLSDGKKWWLTGDADILPWLDRLASITRLEKNCFDGGSRIHFCRMSDPSAQLSESNPLSFILESGWTMWDHKSLRIWFHDSTSDVICEVDNSRGHDFEILNMWNALQPVYVGSICSGGLPLHAALIEREDTAVLLAAPGGTGKSTCCCRLPTPWKPICDDEVLVVCDEKGKYHAHPFPTWSDYLRHRAENRWNIQQSIPLSAIFFFAQAETQAFETIGEGRAAAHVSDSARQVCEKYWRTKDGEPRRALTRNIFSNACELVKTIPAFKLGVNLHGRFWEEIQKALGESSPRHF